MQFVARQRLGARDEGAEERAEHRFALDAAQAVTAQRHVEDVLVVSGPPGSGKTLVLVARARWLATEHPDWKILVLVYNRLLARYLGNLLQTFPNVEVSSFGMYCRQNGHRVSLDDEIDSKNDVSALIRRGLSPVVDALLIDEWQDFHPAWVTLALHLLRPGRGGACLAGDDKQAIYRDSAPHEALRGRQVELVSLDRPYRSTRQILEVVGRLDGTFETSGAEFAPNGEPVDLIHADDWNGQADVISWEIRRMLDSGERLPGDIGVLVTQKMATLNRLPGALEARGIPFEIVDGTELPDPEKVSVLTVHQSKGYEFDVVLLMGLEALPKLTDDPKNSRRCRVGFVGPTRARDQLMITYTRPNAFLRNIQECSELVLRGWNFPDDYEGV
jgi:superfamily I DNA/RNA helicase